MTSLPRQSLTWPMSYPEDPRGRGFQGILHRQLARRKSPRYQRRRAYNKAHPKFGPSNQSWSSYAVDAAETYGVPVAALLLNHAAHLHGYGINPFLAQAEVALMPPVSSFADGFPDQAMDDYFGVVMAMAIHGEIPWNYARALIDNVFHDIIQFPPADGVINVNDLLVNLGYGQ